MASSSYPREFVWGRNHRDRLNLARSARDQLQRANTSAAITQIANMRLLDKIFGVEKGKCSNISSSILDLIHVMLQMRHIMSSFWAYCNSLQSTLQDSSALAASTLAGSLCLFLMEVSQSSGETLLKLSALSSRSSSLGVEECRKNNYNLTRLGKLTCRPWLLDYSSV